MKSISSMEGSSTSHKIQAMKRYRRQRFVYNFVLYSLTSLITCFVFVDPLFFPYASHFWPCNLLNDLSFLFNHKCAFFVGNLIVFILVGNSKFWGTSLSWSSSVAPNIYNEYITRSCASYMHMVTNSDIKKGSTWSLSSLPERSQLRNCETSTLIEKRKKREMTRMRTRDDANKKEQKMGKIRACKSVSEIVKIEEESFVEDKYGMPRDELNKRVEAFIARVNKQRMLELS